MTLTFTPLPEAWHRNRLSKTSAARKPAPIWDLLPAEEAPGVISMLAGKPNPATFPFRHIHLGVRAPGASDSAQTETLVIEGEELDRALQYGTTPGMGELREWLTNLTKEVHKRDPSEGWRVSLGPGSQDILYKALHALLNPGDTVIIEGPTYPGTTPILEAIGCDPVTIEVDAEGIVTSELERVLSTWDNNGNRPFPKVVYTIPFGGNPSGMTASQRRRIEVLNIARKYDMIIIEDDPYYFLYYGDEPKPTSYFCLEKEMGGEVGRVLRLDSFSKVVAAGFRLGWLTGPETLVAAIERHSSISVVQASSLTQVVVLKLLREWKIEGFLLHADATAKFYRQRRDAFLGYLNRHLTGLAEWTVPEASMFFWVKLRLPPTLDCHNVPSETDSHTFIRHKVMDRGVLALPGSTAYVDGRTTARVRVSFSLLSDEQMDEALRRLSVVLKEELGEN